MEKMEKKVFKNWLAICAIQDKFVKWALAMLNLNSDVGKKFVVLENNESCEELHIAPAELIDVDCPVRIRCR